MYCQKNNFENDTNVDKVFEVYFLLLSLNDIWDKSQLN